MNNEFNAHIKFTNNYISDRGNIVGVWYNITLRLNIDIFAIYLGETNKNGYTQPQYQLDINISNGEIEYEFPKLPNGFYSNGEFAIANLSWPIKSKLTNPSDILNSTKLPVSSPDCFKDYNILRKLIRSNWNDFNSKVIIESYCNGADEHYYKNILVGNNSPEYEISGNLIVYRFDNPSYFILTDGASSGKTIYERIQGIPLFSFMQSQILTNTIKYTNLSLNDLNFTGTIEEHIVDTDIQPPDKPLDKPTASDSGYFQMYKTGQLLPKKNKLGSWDPANYNHDTDNINTVFIYNKETKRWEPAPLIGRMQ